MSSLDSVSQLRHYPFARECVNLARFNLSGARFCLSSPQSIALLLIGAAQTFKQLVGENRSRVRRQKESVMRYFVKSLGHCFSSHQRLSSAVYSFVSAS
jgi:hypothetical protein